MPAVISKPAKRTGAPKAKGSVRAKSGCYTCRIRRKKCDEQQDDHGRCQTCLRLRLQCLGFGSKRPDWLREDNKVNSLREQIKVFLSQQGMIKGCSGTGPRGGADEVDILILAPTAYSSSSSSDSPHSQTISLSPPTDDYPRTTATLTTSSVRDYPALTFDNAGMYTISEDDWYIASYDPVPTSLLRPSSSSRQDSPFGASSSHSSYNDALPAGYPDPSVQLTTSSVVPWSPTIPAFLPPMESSFGTSYNLSADHFVDDSEDILSRDQYGYTLLPAMLVPSGSLDELIQHYMKTVVDLQYQLADRDKVPSIIFSAINSTSVSREAARLLASVHRLKYFEPRHSALLDNSTKAQYDDLVRLVSDMETSDDQAMAALHVVSSFLFDGGRGEWLRWLQMAVSYCDDLLADRSRFHNPTDMLMTCTDKERFLVKTTLWFDVIASVTTMKAPHFLNVVRDLYGPSSSSIYDPTSPAPSETSMLTVLGCENTVFWAIAETSALSAWKSHKKEKGSLSVPELAAKGAEIEKALMDSQSVSAPLSFEPVGLSRNYASQIFRSAALVYLRSVVSGDHPHVPEIFDGVNETIRSLQSISQDATIPPSVRSSVVRCTVFPIFISGCLTDNKRDREFLRSLLTHEVGPGNCSSVANMLGEVWQLRGSLAAPVRWRELVRREQILLV